MDYIQIYWTSANLDEARLVARQLVEQRLVASAKIVPWVESIFLYNQDLDTQQESQVILLTINDCFERIKSFILKHSKYELPEIIKTPVLGGHEELLEWVNNQVKPNVDYVVDDVLRLR